MPRVSDLMEVGFNPIQAKHLGAQPESGDFNNLSALGNNSQANAYQIIANYNIFTTIGAATNSAKLPIAESDPHGIYYILNLGLNALNLFPAVGDSLNTLAANTAISMPVGTGIILVKQTITSWQVHRTFGSKSPIINLAEDVTGRLPFTNLAQGSALSVLGVTGNATADNASIAAASDHQVLRRSGTAVAFGAVNLAQANAVTGILDADNGGSEARVTVAAGTITPSAGTITGGTSNYVYSITGDMLNFSLDISGWTQNTSAASSYTIALPVNAVNATRMNFTAQDRSASIVVIASTEGSSTTITIRKAGGATWAAASAVNLVINGQYWIT